MQKSKQQEAFNGIVEEIKSMYPVGSISDSESVEAANRLILFFKTLMEIKREKELK
jgi:hypothetical protein